MGQDDAGPKPGKARSWAERVVPVALSVLILGASLGTAQIFEVPPKWFTAATTVSGLLTAFTLIFALVVRDDERVPPWVRPVALLIAVCAGVFMYVVTPNAPRPASDLIAEAKSGGITFTWDASPDDDKVSEYRLQCDGKRIYVGRLSTATYAGFKPGSVVDCEVVAVAGFYSKSLPARVTVQVPNLGLGAPTLLTALDIQARSVSLQWTPPAAAAVTYWIMRDGQRVGAADDSNYTDTSVRPDTSYTFAVRALSTKDTPLWADSTPITVHTLPEGTTGPTGSSGGGGGGALATPAGLHITGNKPTAVTLAWEPVGGAHRYEVVRDGAVVGTATTPSYVDDGRTPDTSYTFRVRAITASGLASKLSSVASVHTPEPVRELSTTEHWAGNESYPLDPGWDTDLYIDDAEQFLSGQGGATLGIIPSSRPEAYSSCNNATLTSFVAISDLKAGTKLCLRSSEGRRGMITIQSPMPPPPGTMNLTVVVWALS